MQVASAHVLARYTLTCSSTAQCFRERLCFALAQKTTNLFNVPAAGFATSRYLQKKPERLNPLNEDGEMNTHTPSKRDSPRAGGGKTSFRSVAVEAEKTRRDYILGTGKNRFVDPEMVTKVVCFSYCPVTRANQKRKESQSLLCDRAI